MTTRLTKTDHERYPKIMDEYGTAGGILEYRNFDALVEMARELKKTIMQSRFGQEETLEPWFLSI